MQANKTIGIVAPSGSGKTTVIASQIVAVSPCVAIYDPQAARDTQYRMAADHIIDDSDLNAFHKILAEPQFKVLFKPKDPIIEGNKADFTDFAQFIRKCYRRCELIGPMTLIVDEAHFTCADRSIPYDLLKVTTMARSVSLDTVWVTQKISGVNTWLRSNAHEYWFFRIVSERDLNIITILKNPLADYIHYYPTGSLLVSIQDITNDLISLVIQTIEHGIQQTFADPGVLNFEKYREAETMPGGIFPAVPKTGKTVSEGFFQTKTATLSQEVLPFFQQIQQLGQSVSGAQPSLFGGQLAGSRTASEYSMSRAQALQRLQNTWKMFTFFWKTIFAKVIPMYIQEVQEDEHSVERTEQGNFINVFIRRAELEGRIGRIELEANENLPITWSQRKDTYMELLKSQNPMILQALASPENIKSLVESIGLDEFIVPGEDDRQKQYEEIRMLINSEPIVQPPDPMQVIQAATNGLPPPPDVELPSVEIDPDLDNHDVEADVCRTYLVSDAGRLLKIENPLGYKNVLLHMKQHMEQIKQGIAQQQQPGSQTPAQPPGTNSPLTEQTNVATAQ